MEEDSQNSYRIKDIQFFGSARRILLQSANGPCPLLAICNVLLLRNQLQIPQDKRYISFAELVEMVSNRLFDANESDTGDSNSSRAANVRENLSTCLEILPRLNVGLDVNCRFSGPSDFEYTGELAVFDLLDICLYHGWIVSEQDSNAYKVFAHLTYNQVVERLIALEEAQQRFLESSEPAAGSSAAAAVTDHAAAVDAETEEAQLQPGAAASTAGELEGSPELSPEAPPPAPAESSPETSPEASPEAVPEASPEAAPEASPETSPEDAIPPSSPHAGADPETRKTIEEGLLIKEFMDRTASQLSYEGLLALHDAVRERELAVFFRNSHFSAMLKYNKELYLLCTDIAFATSHVVWEKLDEVDGDTSYCNAEFRVNTGTDEDAALTAEESAAIAASLGGSVSAQEQSDLDAALAMQLMQEEVQAQVRQQQQMQNMAAQAQQQPSAVQGHVIAASAAAPAPPAPAAGAPAAAQPAPKGKAKDKKKSGGKSCVLQ